MKKLLLVCVSIGLFFLQSCSITEDNTGIPGPQGPPGLDAEIAEVFELKNFNFGYNIEDGYHIYQKLTPKIFASDVILIYRLSGTIDSNTPIWQPIPRTLFLPQGELDYDFDFSREDFTIYAGGNYNLNLTPQYLNNQTFRIVIVPGNFSTLVDKNNYNAVISELNINENQIKKINF